MKKKIICTVTNDLTHDQRMIRICTSLANANYKIVLVGRLRKQSKKIIPQPFEQKRLQCFFNKGKLFYLEYNIRLLIFLFFQKFDLICSVDLDTILPGYYVSKWKNKEVVYDAHEYFTEVPEVVLRPKVKAIWEKVAQRTIPNITYNYTVCESLSKIFQERYGPKFEVIRNVPFAKKNEDSRPTASSEILTLAKNAEQAKQKILLYQGALNDGRGIEEIINIMPDVNAQLWLIGEGDLSQDLRNLVQQKDLSSKVIFFGMRTPKELKTITPFAYIGLNLLQNKGLSYYYSLANKAFDYIQAQRPAIHMDFPEYQKLNQAYETSVLVPDLKPENLLKAVNQLLEDDTYYERLKENCIPAAKEFTWEKEEVKLKDFYENIFSNMV